MIGTGSLIAAVVTLLSMAAPVITGDQSAAEAERLTIGQAVEMALAQYPSVAASRAGKEEADAAVGVARAGWWPTLSLTGSATRHEEPMLVAPIHSLKLGEQPAFDKALVQSGLWLNYIIFDGGGRGGRVQLARAKAAAAGASLDAVQQALVAQVGSTYFGIISKRRILEAHDSRIASLDSELSRVRQLFGEGRAAQVEVLRMEAAVANAQAERVRFAAVLDAAVRDLARLAGTTTERTSVERLVPARLVDSTIASRDGLIEEALKHSPALAQSRGQWQASKANLSVAASARWPALKLTGTYVDWGDFEGSHSREWTAGAHLSFPIFTGGAISNDIARASAASRGAGEQLRLAEIQLRQDIDRTVSAVEETRARVTSLEKAVATYAEVARIEKLSLETGSGIQTDFLGAEADLLAARANLAEARFLEIAARLELARLTGALSSAWFAQNLEAGE